MRIKSISISIMAALVTACTQPLTGSNGVLTLISKGAVPGTEFTRYELSSLNSNHFVYMAESIETDLALLVVIQGSGCDSVFAQSKDRSSYLSTAAQDIIFALSGGKYRVVIADKPNVKFADTGSNGGMENCSIDFKRSHSLNSWTNALSDTIDAAKAETGTENGSVRILGLSEGAIVGARLAAVRDDVSHVAFISGFGCNQIGDMLVASRRNWMAQNPEAKGSDLQTGVAVAVKDSEDAFARVFEDPSNTSYLIEGQTPLFWSTFGTACPAKDLASSKAKVFLAYGTEDEQISGDGIEAIVAGRLVDRKRTKTIRIIGGSHILATEDEGSPFENMLDVFSEALTWMGTSEAD